MDCIGIVGNPKHNQYFEQVIKENNLFLPNLEYKYFNKDNQNFLSELSGQESSISVLICGPANKKVVAPALSKAIPIISIQPRLSDILYACIQSASLDERICILSPYSLTHLISITPILRKDLNIQLVRYSSAKSIDQCMKEIVDEGYKSVVGGFGACYAAERYCIKPFLYYSAECIMESIKSGLQIISAIRQEREIQINLQSVIDAGDIGMILVENDLIRYLNAPAEKILGSRGYEIIGHSIDDILFFPEDSGESATRVASINGNDILLQCVMLSKGQTVYRLQEIRAFEQASDAVRTQAYKKYNTAKYSFFDIVGKEISQTIEIAKSFAKSSDASILIMGQTGSGKELFASSIHNSSSRCKENFVAINCAALPEALLESELFGYEPGSFTGARKQGKHGLIELAHKGTLFLDEISELPFSLQAKLLRVIQEREILHIGGDELIPVDIRIISATNRDLLAEVQNNRFRADLYYRLSTLMLRVPSLKERGSDYLELTDFFLKDRMLPAQYKKFIKMAVSNCYANYSWPGNVRELQNVIERALTYVSYHFTSQIAPADLMLGLSEILLSTNAGLSDDFSQLLPAVPQSSLTKSALTRQEAEKILEQCGGNHTLTAARLGISRTTLWRKLNGKA